jgi:hypothetical protein
MATWRSTDGTITSHGTRDSIILRALRICSVVADSELPTPSMTANAAEAFNALVKQWDSMGIHLWTMSEGVVFIQPNQYQYSLDVFLPPSQNADRTAQNWRLNTLATSMGIGATSVVVHTWTDYGLSDIQVADELGIVTNNGRVSWGTVATVSPLTITPGLPDPAQPGAYIFLLRKRLEQPLRIVSARRFILSNHIETPLLPLSRLDYREMPNKETQGTITSYFYDPQLFTGYVSFWPAPQDVSALARITYYRRMQDLTSPTDVPDLPQEWANALTWNLAKEIAPEYDVPIQKYSGIIIPRAAETLDMVQGFDKEPESVYFGVNMTPNSR